MIKINETMTWKPHENHPNTSITHCTFFRKTWMIVNENIHCLFKNPSKPGRSGDHDFTTRPHPTRHMIAVCRHVTHDAIRLNVAIYKNNISIYHTPTANTEEEETVSQILHVYTERVIMWCQRKQVWYEVYQATGENII